MSAATPEEIEQSVRNWVHHLEQGWNDGDVDGCIAQLQPEVTVSHQARTRTLSREKLRRCLRLWFAPGTHGQIKGVIKSVQVLEGLVEVIAHLHLRCLRAEQLEEGHIHARVLIVSGGRDSWAVGSIHLLPPEQMSHKML